MSMFKETPQGILATLKVLPKSSVNKICGIENGTLRIKVTSPPDKNLANEAVISLLSKAFKIAKSYIEIVKGHQSRQKTVCFFNQSKKYLEEQLEEILKEI